MQETESLRILGRFSKSAGKLKVASQLADDRLNEMVTRKDISPPMPAPPKDMEANRLINEIYNKYDVGLKSFIARRLNSMEDVDDVAQDVYVRLLQHRKIETLKPSLALLCKIASNIMKDRFRYQRIRKMNDHIPLEDMQISSSVATPEQILSTKEEIANYWRAFEELNEKQRQAFVLHRLKGLTYVEIALEMGTTKHMVKKYITGAVVRLRKKFA